MKAVQIDGYSKTINTVLREIPIQGYQMPLTLGYEALQLVAKGQLNGKVMIQM